MSWSLKLQCPACGAPLEVTDRFAKLVVCPYCDQVHYLKDEALDPTGKTAKLAQFPSLFSPGCRGTIKGKSFEAQGRLRFRHPEGFWDEWYLLVEQKPFWLQEDEGEYTLFKKEPITGSLPPWENLRVGSTVEVNNQSVFVTEKGKAEIAGAEGQLPTSLLPGEALFYFDGASGGRVVSVEMWPQEMELSVGEPVAPEEIKIS